MKDFQLLCTKPKVVPPLDPEFRPISLGNRAYLSAVRTSKTKCPIGIAVERNEGYTSVFKTDVFAPGMGHDPETLIFLERIVKFLLWQKGGWKVVVGGPKIYGDHLRNVYSKNGIRAFDVDLMQTVYEKDFLVEIVDFNELPKAHESSVALGRNLDGCRIGFDLGASDYKIAAVKDGEAVFTIEIPWDPKIESNPEFHRRKINEGLKLAAKHLPRVDAIGGSSAGIYIDNKVMIASLFRAVSKPEFEENIKPLFIELSKEWKVPIEVVNDGDVTALAGAMSLQANSVLGIAMGSSEAVGFLDGDGRITGWLNELAFAPIDYNSNAAADEWSGDIGCGALYFSQQAVVKLAPKAGIELPAGHQAEQLKYVQELHKNGDQRAVSIFETIGVYLGYALAQYADMYDYQNVLILGRVTSGAAGDIILDQAKQVLKTEFPDIAKRIQLHLPDEKSKRVGQAVAAASLPVSRKIHAVLAK